MSRLWKGDEEPVEGWWRDFEMVPEGFSNIDGKIVECCWRGSEMVMARLGDDSEKTVE